MHAVYVCMFVCVCMGVCMWGACNVLPIDLIMGRLGCQGKGICWAKVVNRQLAAHKWSHV